MRQRYITLPETWDELTPDDWQGLLRIRHTMMTIDHAWTAEDARTETACMLLKNRGLKPRTGDPQYLTLIGQLQASLTWLWQEEGDGRLSLVYRSTRNLLPSVNIGTSKEPCLLLGPEDHGNDLSFGEFRMAYAVLRDYEQKPSERVLNVLAGLLYRPGATEAQRHSRQLRRQPYDWDGFAEKEARGSRMERWQVWGAYAWFAYFCEYLTTGYFCIEGETVSFAPLFGGGGQQQDAAGGSRRQGSLQRVALAVASSRVFGTFREVDRTPLLTVMLKLLTDHECAEDMRRKLNSKKP